MTPNGFIAYKGPSLFDGAPIVAIVTGIATPSRNPKTGPMAQLGIFREDIDPVTAHKLDFDKSVCGNCPLRKTADGKRACYITLCQFPLSTWKAYKRGAYPDLTDRPALLETLSGKGLRIGSYGDPVAVPFSAVKPLIDKAEFRTGYTHAWRRKIADIWKGFLMASVETQNQQDTANAKGWNCFRVLPRGEDIPRLNFLCANERQGVSCSNCNMCNGRNADVCIHAHGIGAQYLPTIKKAPIAGER